MKTRLPFACACLLAASVLNWLPSYALALDGRIVDAKTGGGIEDAIAILGDREARADKTGRFHLDGASDRLLARAPGYRAVSLATADVDKAGGVVKLAPFAPRALYLSVYGIGSRTLRDGALGLIRSGAANALVIDLKGDRGIVPFPSSTPLTRSPGARQITSIPDLAAFAKTMHGQGVYLIARIVTFKDNPLAEARRDLAIKRANGELFRDREGLAWTDPFRAEVRTYNIDLAVEAARAGFDEVQFDYVRFPDSSGELSLAEPSTATTRPQAITDFLAEARRRLTPYNTFLGVDIFGYVCWNQNDTGIGQRLEEITPHVDYLSPMLYPSGFRYGIPGVRNPVTNVYAIVRQSLAEAQARLNVSPKRFRPWLQAFRDYAFDHRVFDADEVAEQIRAASDFGSDGWMLWNARNTYSDVGIAKAGAAPKAVASTRPDSGSSSSCR